MSASTEKEPLLVRLLLPIVEAVCFVGGVIHRVVCFAAKQWPVAAGRPLLWIYVRLTAGWRKNQEPALVRAVVEDKGIYPPPVVELANRIGLLPASVVETRALGREEKLEVIRTGLEKPLFATTDAVFRVRCLAAVEPALFLETLGAAASEVEPASKVSVIGKRAEHALRYLEAGVHAWLFDMAVRLLKHESGDIRVRAAAHLAAFGSDAVIPYLSRISEGADNFWWVREVEHAIESGRATPAFRDALWKIQIERLECGSADSTVVRLLFIISPEEAFALLKRPPYIDSERTGPAVIEETVKRRMSLPAETLKALLARPADLEMRHTRTLLEACILARLPGTEERILALLEGPVRNDDDRTRIEGAYGLLLAWHGAPDLRKMLMNWERQHGDNIEKMPALLAETSLLAGYGYFKNQMLDGVFKDLALDAPGRMQAALKRCGLTKEAAVFGAVMRALRSFLPLWKAQQYGFLPEPDCVSDLYSSLLHRWGSSPPIYHEVARFAWEHREEAKRIAAGDGTL